MRRRKLRWATVGLVALTGVGVFVLWPRPSQVTPESFDRIRLGMGRAEVEAIFGPPGDYRTRPIDPSGALTIIDDPEWNAVRLSDEPETTEKVWRSDSVEIRVVYPKAGALTYALPWSADEVDQYLATQTPWENLRWRAERQWRRWFP